MAMIHGEAPKGAFQVSEGDHTIIHTPNVGAGIAHHWSMWHDPTDKMVGQLHQRDDGTVSAIEVHPKHRRSGVATKMWNIVNSISQQDKSIPAPKHATSRTAAGDKFAKSIGGEIPKRTVVNQNQFKNARWS